jgi:acetolactate synthase-1/2/3 large subunit
MKMIGARALIEGLRRERVEVIFGYPGGQVLPIYDELYDSKDIRHILVRHEQGAAHAADGYARASGKVGACLATSGPGATNLVTGIATAYMDSVPIVAITGQVPTFAIGKDSFQEVDITGITLPITKHNYLVTHAAEIPHIVKEAFYIAGSGRPGPVLIDFPRDMQSAEVEFDYPETIELPGYRPTTTGHPRMIKRAAELIASAERPLIYGGGGVNSADAQHELVALAERVDAPVTMTLLGKGGFPEDHDLYLGMPGMHGTAYANYALHEADIIIAVGTRFDDRVTGKLDMFARTTKFIHIDIDPAEIGKNVAPLLPIVGDVKQVLGELGKRVSRATHPEWRKTVDGWKQQYPMGWKGNGLKPQYVIQQIHKATKGDAIVVTEVGQNQMWAAQWYACKRTRQFISSGGLGTMGYGLPAAMGAQVARPKGHRRGREHPDEHSRTCHLCRREDPREDRSAQQRIPRHGSTMADAFLQEPSLLHRSPGGHSRLREARGGLRRRWPSRQRGIGGGQSHQTGHVSEGPAVSDRLRRDSRRERDAHGPRGRHSGRHARGLRRGEISMKHTISVLVNNRPGVLARTAGLFARRGFNIDSLAVSTTQDSAISRMTIVVEGPDQILEQISKQLYKLMDVIRVLDHQEEDVVNRELALIKVDAEPGERAEIMQIVSIFRANIVDISEKTFIIEVTGSADKVDALEKLLEKYGIREMMRTGRIVLSRGPRTA